MKSKTWAHFLIPIAALLCLTPWLGSGGALVLGLVLALAFGNPYSEHMKRWTHTFFGLAVAGLGGIGYTWG